MKILVLCTGNSCRSQMAEGFLRKYMGERADIFSAGIEKHGMNPNAVRMMKEAGVDISSQYSKSIDDLTEKDFDYVITVCDNARENCPYYPAHTKLIHQTFTDPSSLNYKGVESDEAYRICRDAISAFCKDLSEKL